MPLDTLDFTSFTMELGSKIILDATKKQRPLKQRWVERDAGQFKSLDRRILDVQNVEGCLLLVKVSQGGREIIGSLVGREELRQFSMIATVSEDVDIHDQEQSIWGLFTRFDCERDVIFTEQKLIGISPVYRGVMGIDATWKKGYPDPLRMPVEVRSRVEECWDRYWQ